jgi:hypothetical protein
MTEKRLTTPLTPEMCCSDIKKSLQFYTETLGFSVQYERPEDGFAMLERQGSRIMTDQFFQPQADFRHRFDCVWTAYCFFYMLSRGGVLLAVD